MAKTYNRGAGRSSHKSKGPVLKMKGGFGLIDLDSP
jgi:hypothetical protein